MARKVKGVVRVGLIGAGGISGAHGGGYLKHTDKIKVVALADVDEKNLAARNQQLGGECRLFPNWRKMLKKMGDQIDAVDICLPHHLHKAAILDAVQAGKHVLCEKPMCMTLQEADAILSAVKKAGVTYMSAHNQLFIACVAEAKRMVEAGELGRLYWIRSQDCFQVDRTAEQWGWRRTLKTQGGGELIDTGYHPTYRLLYLAGAPAEAVRASFARFHCPIEGEDTASVTIRFANGVIGEILTSWAFPVPTGSHLIHLIGEKGELYGGGNELYFRPKGYAAAAQKRLASTDCWADEIGHFATCLREGKRPIHAAEEGRAVLEIIVRATESARGWEKKRR